MPSNLYRRGDTYYGRYSVHGELQRVSLRTGDIREARRRLSAIRKKAEQQAFGVESRATWREAVIAYATGVLDAGGVKPETAKRYRVSLRQLHEHFASKPLPLITIAEVGSFVSERQRAGATNATIRRDLTTASRVCAFARHHGLMETNPFEGYDRSLLREIRPGITAPGDADIEAAAEAARAAGDAPIAALIRFLRATGMRAGEALRATREDLRGATLMIPVTKTSRVRTIDVPPAAIPPGGGGRLFPDLPLDSGALASRWQWLRRGFPAGQQFRLHDLRHAYAIAEIRAGRDIYDLSRHLGHSSVKTSEIYLGYAPGRSPASRKSDA